MITQKQMVRGYLEKYGSITTLQAFRDLCIMDLQGAIRDLIKEGMDIQKKIVYKRNRFGKMVHFKKYFIRNESFMRRLTNAIFE